jgi:hypothetical protein
MTAARQLRARQELRRAGGDAKLATQAGELPRGYGGRVEPVEDGSAGDGAWWPDFKSLLQNRFMVVNILFAALLFAPSGIYLLWDYTNWETMQAGGSTMPAWLIVSFAITNVTQAVLGFWVTERLIVHGHQYLAALQAFIGYFGMFFILIVGWDGTGWHRFFSEDKADFAAWSSQPEIDQITSWLTSGVALTLFGMGVILIPTMIVIMLRNYRGGFRLGGAYTPSRRAMPATVMTLAYTAFLLSGVPLAIVCHILIDQLGWILGSVVSALFIYLTCLNTRFGLFHVFYQRLAPEDEAYERLRRERQGGAAAPAAGTA